MGSVRLSSAVPRGLASGRAVFGRAVFGRVRSRFGNPLGTNLVWELVGWGANPREDWAGRNRRRTNRLSDFGEAINKLAAIACQLVRAAYRPVSPSFREEERWGELSLGMTQGRC